MIDIRPQPGPQEKFLETEADIALYGGAAGGGKTFALLLEPLRHGHIGDFGAVVFRRTLKQVFNEGGIWDEASKIYPLLAAQPNLSDYYWKFPSGMTVSFSHLEHEKNIYDWQGGQITCQLWDELTHFTKKMFFYMLSRNRSTCGVRPYVRATTNPDKNSWVRAFIDWWIGADGFAIPERSGVIRYFQIINDEVIWKDRAEEFDKPELAKSFTFISAKLSDNKILMEKDPGYLANLSALPKVEREKLLDGNWNAEEKPGEFFRREWFAKIPAVPENLRSIVRYWDRAASESDTADYTVGCKLGIQQNGRLVVLNVVRFRGTPNKVEARIKNVATTDGQKVIVGIEVDPGQAGKMESEYLAKQLMGYTVKLQKPSADKATRAGPISSQVEAGNVDIVDGPWNEAFFSELESFPGSSSSKDDQVDALSGAFAMILGNQTGVFTSDMSEFDEKENLNW